MCLATCSKSKVDTQVIGALWFRGLAFWCFSFLDTSIDFNKNQKLNNLNKPPNTGQRNFSKNIKLKNTPNFGILDPPLDHPPLTIKKWSIHKKCLQQNEI